MPASAEVQLREMQSVVWHDATLCFPVAVAESDVEVGDTTVKHFHAQLGDGGPVVFFGDGSTKDEALENLRRAMIQVGESYVAAK
jgi:hypothetical protein